MNLLPQYAESLKPYRELGGLNHGQIFMYIGGARRMGRTHHRRVFEQVTMLTVFPEKLKELMQKEHKDMTEEERFLRCKFDHLFFIKHYCKIK